MFDFRRITLLLGYCLSKHKMNLGVNGPHCSPLDYAYVNGNRRDKVALRTTCIKNVKFKSNKTRTGCQYVGYFYHSENLNRAAQNPRLGRMRAAGWI